MIQDLMNFKSYRETLQKLNLEKTRHNRVKTLLQTRRFAMTDAEIAKQSEKMCEFEANIQELGAELREIAQEILASGALNGKFKVFRSHGTIVRYSNATKKAA